MIKTEIGAVTAYADAVKAGYTGTREEFARDQANFAQNASEVAEMKRAVERTVEEFGSAAQQAKQDVSDEGDRQIQRIADAAPDLELDRAQIEKNKKAIEGKITNPAGGTNGQVLTKTAEGEEWKEPTGGDVPTKLSDLQEDTTHRTVTDTEKETWNGKYAKPETGIPASDLAEGAIPDVSKKLTQPETAQVGQIFRVQSITKDGNLVLEAVDMPSGGDVTDVQINGASIVGEDGVAVVPVSASGKLGLVLPHSTYGINIINGYIKPISLTQSTLGMRAKIGSNMNYGLITTENYDDAVRLSMSAPIGNGMIDNVYHHPAWTADEQAAARERIGVGNFELIEEIVIEESIAGFTRNVEPDGTPYDFKGIYIYMYSPKTNGEHGGRFYFHYDNENLYSPAISFTIGNDYITLGICELFGLGLQIPFITDMARSYAGSALNASQIILQDKHINRIEYAIPVNSAVLMQGDIIKIYGMRW